MGIFTVGLISSLLIGDKQFGSVVAWAFLGSALGFINQYFFSFLRILRKSIASVAFSLISLVGGVGFTVMLLNEAPGSLLAPFQALAAAQIIISVVFIALYGRVAFIARLERRELSNLLAFGGASIIVSFGSIILEWADRIIIEQFLTLADVGAYSAAVRVGTLINVIFILPFSQIWSPMMMEYKQVKHPRVVFSSVVLFHHYRGRYFLLGRYCLLANCFHF